MPSAFIDDGYTLDGYIAAREGLFDAVSFQYRPMTRREAVVLEGDIGNAKDFEAAEVVAAKCIAKKLASWDLTTPKGKPVDITADNLLRLQPVIAGVLLDIIRGRRGSDQRPDSDDSPPAPHNGDAAAGNC